MKCAKLLETLALVAMGLAFQINPVTAQGSLRERLIGTWIYVHNYNVGPDGKRFEPQGPEGTGKGILILDAGGRFVWNLIRADIPKFASNNRQKGTDVENRAVSQGAVGYYGTYQVEDSSNTLTMRIEFSSFPNFNGTEQKRTIKLE